MLTTAEDLYNEFMNLADEENLFDTVANKNRFLQYLATESNDGGQGFFWAPASTKYHGAHPGGLYQHSRQVYKRLKELTKRNMLTWLRPQSPFIIGMFHDICKSDQYKQVDGTVLTFQGQEISKPEGTHYEFNNKTLLKGHGSKSVMILSQFINLTEEEMLCIRYHMGAYETDEWEEFNRAIRKYPNVLWTHHADMLASKVDDV